MSFDLGVWFEAEPISDVQAAITYRTLCEGDDDRADPTHPLVAAFYRELTERFPTLDKISDADIERSPWTAGLSTTATSVVMAITWPRAAEVADVVRRLADRHGLVCYDPQAGAVSQAATLRSGPQITLSCCDGSRVVGADAARIEAALRRISPDNWFAIAERDEQWWVQVGYGEMAGARAGRYALERHDGSADRHYRATTSDINEVINAFQRFAQGDDSWVGRFTWGTVSL